MSGIYVEGEPAKQFTDVVGMVGGILGLYLGASLLTIVHIFVFWGVSLCKKVKRRKTDVY